MQNKLFWLNLALFASLIFFFLKRFAIGWDIALSPILLIIVFFIFGIIVYFEHRSLISNNEVERKKFAKRSLYFALGVTLIGLLVLWWVSSFSGDIGLLGAVIMLILIIIGVVTYSTFLFLKILKKVSDFTVAENTNKNIKYSFLITIILVIAIIGFIYNIYFTLGSCSGQDCRYKYFYENPSICQAHTYYAEYCFIKTAMYFSDIDFCNNIRAEDLPTFATYCDGPTNLCQKDISLDEMRQRCKKWVEYYNKNKNQEILNMDYRLLSRSDPVSL